MALPDLQAYMITPRATDVIEDAVSWMAQRPNLAPDGRVGIVGISFAGGLSIAAAGRPAIRDKVAFILSFGGHGDLPRVMRYLATGEAPQVAGLATHPPHDYGVAVILYGLADNGVVPADQVAASARRHQDLPARVAADAGQHGPGERDVREGARDGEGAAGAVAHVHGLRERSRGGQARSRAGAVPRPARRRAIRRCRRSARPRRRRPPIYLLHGDDDTVIPAAESALLDDYLRSKGANVHLLLSNLITHAEVNRAASASRTRGSWCRSGRACCDNRSLMIDDRRLTIRC